jgi:oligoribonuclease NrnB/cAMP/cGMP phosphodiesterase (DHH superfamily)
MKTLIIYHARCTDGFGAAFAAWCKFGDDAEYLPMQYGQDLLKEYTNLLVDRDIYVLDFSFDKATTEWIIDHSNSFTWLDHHKTAFEMWCDDGERNRREDSNGRDYVLLDNNKSGAMLAWEYFHPGTTVPHLIQYIDDRDRWVFKHDESRPLHAGLRVYPQKFREWAYLVPAMGGTANALVEVIETGRTILQVYDEQIKSRVKVAEKCNILKSKPREGGEHWECDWVVNAEGLAVNSPMHQSEIGNELAKASGTYGLVWYYDSATKRANVSLRSIGDYDVSAIAKAFGGGGHQNAAGCSVDMSTLLGWLK